jgi:DNA repair protein RadC
VSHLKLRLSGVESLTDEELLCALLGGAVRGIAPPEVVRALLGRGQPLGRLFDVAAGELARIRGLGPSGAIRLQSALELARRLARAPGRAGAPLATASAVDALLRGELAFERRERVHVLLVDARQRLLGDRCVSVGSLTSSVIHPRELFRPAIALAAAALILVHNHPSGDPTPSTEDHQVTMRIAEAGTLLGIRLLDHVIIAAEGYRSFREEGWLA